MSDFLTGNVDVINTTPIPVSISGGSSTTVNICATNNSVTYGVETTVLTYTNTGISFVTQVIGWGTYDGEFLLRINGTIVGGGRTSAAQRTLQITAPFPTVVSDVITITILEYGPGMQQFRANLIGE